jgi:hypothetical protein
MSIGLMKISKKLKKMERSKVKKVYSLLRVGHLIKKAEKWHPKRVQKLALKDHQFSRSRANYRGDMSMNKLYSENRNRLKTKILLLSILKLSKILMKKPITSKSLIKKTR